MRVEAALAPVCYHTSVFSKEEQQPLERFSLFIFTASVTQQRQQRQLQTKKPNQRATVDEGLNLSPPLTKGKKQKKAGVSRKQHPLYFWVATPTSVYLEAISYLGRCRAHGQGIWQQLHSQKLGPVVGAKNLIALKRRSTEPAQITVKWIWHPPMM